MRDGLRTGIWKRSLRNASQESCLHNNIYFDRQATLRSHTKVRPVLVTLKNRLSGLGWIASLPAISQTLLLTAAYIHCVAAHTGLSGCKAPLKPPEISHSRDSELVGANCFSRGSVTYVFNLLYFFVDVTFPPFVLLGLFSAYLTSPKPLKAL